VTAPLLLETSRIEIESFPCATFSLLQSSLRYAVLRLPLAGSSTRAMLSLPPYCFFSRYFVPVSRPARVDRLSERSEIPPLRLIFYSRF